MPETRKQFKERMMRAGLWQSFVAERERLKASGVPPREAREQALNKVASRTRQSMEPAPATKSAKTPAMRRQLCSRCATASRMGHAIPADCTDCKLTTAKGPSNDFHFQPDAYMPPELRAKL